MKHEPQTVLGRWMRENRYSDQTFADAVNSEIKRLGSQKTVTAAAVGKWRLGTSVPRKVPLRAIGALTEGAVPYESFVEGAT